MKRLLSMLAALILAAVLSVPAGAAVSAEIVRAFVCDGMLYTYVTVDGAEKPITKAEARPSPLPDGWKPYGRPGLR